jgi:hypothetical protein
MRNHDDKTRDMARSVLPSTARKKARRDRAAVRSRERAAERQLLHELRCCVSDLDDVDAHTAWQDRRGMADLVEDRRGADKVTRLPGCWFTGAPSHDTSGGSSASSAAPTTSSPSCARRTARFSGSCARSTGQRSEDTAAVDPKRAR